MLAVPGSAHPPRDVYFSKVLLVRSSSPALHISLAPCLLCSFPVQGRIPVEFRGFGFSVFGWDVLTCTQLRQCPACPRSLYPCAPALLCTPILKYPTQLFLTQMALLFIQNLDFKSPVFPTVSFPFPLSFPFSWHFHQCIASHTGPQFRDKTPSQPLQLADTKGPQICLKSLHFLSFSLHLQKLIFLP